MSTDRAALRAARIAAAKLVADPWDAGVAFDRLQWAAPAVVRDGLLPALDAHKVRGERSGLTGYHTILSVITELVGGGDPVKLDRLPLVQRRVVVTMALAILAHATGRAELRVDPTLAAVAREVETAA